MKFEMNGRVNYLVTYVTGLGHNRTQVKQITTYKIHAKPFSNR